MKMAVSRKDGCNIMYTNFLRKLAKFMRQVSGHCGGGGGGMGHCY